MKTSTLILSIVFSFATVSSFAQSTTPATGSATTPAPAVAGVLAPAMKDMADAEVRKVDKEAKKVTLKHGPIKNLDMPGMTMVFQVRDEKLFDKLISGEKIKFTAEQLQGAFVVTSVEKAEAK